MKSSDILNKIKEVIIGKSFEDLSDINKSLKKLSAVSTLKSTATFTELLKSISNPKDPESVTGKQLEELLKEIGVNFEGIQPEDSRLQRYTTYESIVRKIPYLKRGLRVMTQSILSPDDIDKVSLTIKVEDTVNIEKETVLSEVQRVLKAYEIEKHAYSIVYTALKKGDYFIEVTDADEVLKDNKLLSENLELGKTKVNVQLLESSEVSTNNIMLLYHEPERVVRIGDNICFGYLVFPKWANNTNQINMNFNQNDISSIVSKLLSKVQVRSDEILKSKDELKQIVAKLLLQSNQGNNVQIVARFVPAENIIHFTPAISEFKPYGTSIFYGEEFLSKIVIAQQSALMVQRIMNSMEKRIVKVELGVTRDAKKYLQQFKETLRRKKYTVDNLGNIDEIPSNIATFEDMYLPVMNGRELVSIDNLPPRGDIGTHVEDLKHLRDTLVAGLEIPPAFLGLEENVESKAMLTQENIIFAMTVVNYQKQFSEAFTKLVRLLVDKNSKINPNTFTLNFNAPRMILAAVKSEYFTNVIDIITKLRELGIPEKYLIQKYLPEFNIDELKKSIINDNLEKATGKEKEGNSTNMGAWS